MIQYFITGQKPVFFRDNTYIFKIRNMEYTAIQNNHTGLENIGLVEGCFSIDGEPKKYAIFDLDGLLTVSEEYLGKAQIDGVLASLGIFISKDPETEKIYNKALSRMIGARMPMAILAEYFEPLQPATPMPVLTEDSTIYAKTAWNLINTAKEAYTLHRDEEQYFIEITQARDRIMFVFMREDGWLEKFSRFGHDQSSDTWNMFDPDNDSYRVNPLPGVAELIAAFRKRGIQFEIATASDRYRAVILLKGLFAHTGRIIAEIYRTGFSYHNVLDTLPIFTKSDIKNYNSKVDLMRYRKIMLYLHYGLLPKDVIVFEDSASGAAAAVLMGYDVILVNNETELDNLTKKLQGVCGNNSTRVERLISHVTRVDTLKDFNKKVTYRN